MLGQPEPLDSWQLPVPSDRRQPHNKGDDRTDHHSGPLGRPREVDEEERRPAEDGTAGAEVVEEDERRAVEKDIGEDAVGLASLLRRALSFGKDAAAGVDRRDRDDADTSAAVATMTPVIEGRQPDGVGDERHRVFVERPQDGPQPDRQADSEKVEGDLRRRPQRRGGRLTRGVHSADVLVCRVSV